MNRLLCLLLASAAIAPAASRAHKNRCSDAVGVVRGAVGFVYNKQPVDPQKVAAAEAHLAQMAGRYKQALQQLDSAGKWDPNDPDLAECVGLMKPMRAYILTTQEKIKQAKAFAVKGGPILEAAKAHAVRNAFLTLAVVHVEPTANAFQNLTPVQAKQMVDLLANIAAACRQAMPEAMTTPPPVAVLPGNEIRVGNVVLPGNIDTKPDWLCYVSAQRDQLALRALGNVMFSTPNYGNPDRTFKEIADKGTSWNGAADSGIFDIAANEAPFMGQMKAAAAEWYQAFGFPLPGQPFPGLAEKILAFRQAVNAAAARNPIQRLPHKYAPMETRARAYTGKLYPKMAILATWMDESAYTVRTNALGVPLSRYRSGQIVYRVNNDSFCRQRAFSFSEAHQGGGTYVPGGDPTLIEGTRAVKCP